VWQARRRANQGSATPPGHMYGHAYATYACRAPPAQRYAIWGLGSHRAYMAATPTLASPGWSDPVSKYV